MKNQRLKKEVLSENRIQVGLPKELRDWIETKASDPVNPRSKAQVIADCVRAAYLQQAKQQPAHATA